MSPHQLALSLCLLGACSTPHEPPQKDVRAEDVSTAAEVGGGVALIEHFECARCHQGVGEVSTIKDCTGCHQEILRGEFDAEASIVAGWQGRLGDTNNALIDTLDLRRAGYFRRDWIASFLKNPADLRPALGPTMPRLAITEEQANAIAAALVPTEEFEPIQGDAEQGRTLVAQGRCGRCHLRGGLSLPGHEVSVAGESSRRAPDLAHVGRWQSAPLLRWLMDPRSVDPGTLMPQTGYSQADAQDVAAFLLQPTSAATANEEPGRLPLLERDVFHDEVEAQVFRRLCWHCHGDPDYARSEGGPGNTGGFGFVPRRLDLSSYEGVMSGAVDEEGQRYSVVFNEGTPRIVEALLARHREVGGSLILGDVRGMPLGIPPLSFNDIRLVESWIAQGARR